MRAPAVSAGALCSTPAPACVRSESATRLSSRFRTFITTSACCPSPRAAVVRTPIRAAASTTPWVGPEADRVTAPTIVSSPVFLSASDLAFVLAFALFSGRPGSPVSGSRSTRSSVPVEPGMYPATNAPPGPSRTSSRIAPHPFAFEPRLYAFRGFPNTVVLPSHEPTPHRPSCAASACLTGSARCAAHLIPPDENLCCP